MARPRYQKGSLQDRGDRWEIRWREYFLDSDTGKEKSTHRKSVLSKQLYPSRALAQRALEDMLREINKGKPPALPPGLSAVEVMLCDSCRARLIAALGSGGAVPNGRGESKSL